MFDCPLVMVQSNRGSFLLKRTGTEGKRGWDGIKIFSTSFVPVRVLSLYLFWSGVVGGTGDVRRGRSVRAELFPSEELGFTLSLITYLTI